MAITKSLISSPLEAGPSLLDIKQIPSELTSAFEYISSRLARKRLHLSLIVIRKDIQLPGLPSLKSQIQSTTTQRTPSPTNSITSSSTISTSGSRSIFTPSISPSNSIFKRTPSKSSTHSTPSSSTSSTPSAPTTPPPNTSSISLLHAPLNPKAHSTLLRILNRASQKHPQISPSILISSSTTTTSTTTHQIHDLLAHSITQNEILFQSPGLTLLSLDHLYTLKSHLHKYSNTLSSLGLSCAVDELHRCVLSRNGRGVKKEEVLRRYEWLEISRAAMCEVDQGYKGTYGGLSQVSGLEMGIPTPKSSPIQPTPQPAQNNLRINTDLKYPIPRRVRLTYCKPEPQPQDEGYESQSTLPLTPPMTSSSPSNSSQSEGNQEEEHKKEDEGYASSPSNRTSISSEICLDFYSLSPSYSPTLPLKPTSPIKASSPPNSNPTTSASITTSKPLPPTPLTISPIKPKALSPISPTPTQTTKTLPSPKLLTPKLDTSFLTSLRTSTSGFKGPMTPNGYEDITPVTKGEWGFLMVGDGAPWNSGRRVPVVTC